MPDTVRNPEHLALCRARGARKGFLLLSTANSAFSDVAFLYDFAHACAFRVFYFCFFFFRCAPSSADNINPFFQKLFETGVDEMSWDDMDEMQVRSAKAQ